MKKCSVEGCVGPGPFVRGWCNAHYLKVRKYGDPHYVAKPPPPVGMKTCCQCRETLAAVEFNKHAASKDGLYPSCRSCTNRGKRDRYAEDPESAKARLRASYLRRRDKALADGRESWAKRDPEDSRHKFRAGHLKRKFGITLAQYDDMFAEQQGLCAICQNPEVDVDARTGRLRYLAIDHCHASGSVRGLLCRRCNTALGLLEDDRERIRKMLDYLG